MFIFLLALTILFGLLLIGGFIWIISGSGQTRRRSGPEVGAEIMGQVMAASDEEQGDVNISIAEASVFKGTGVSVEKEVSVGYDEIKAMVRAGRWRESLPTLLAMAGVAGFLAFGSLTILVRWDNKLVAAIIVVVVFYTLARIAISFARA
jgi:hypothetical protein